MANELTIKQEKFCQFYVDTGNASEAYRMAYDAANMQYATINVKACELLKNGKVAVRVQALKEKMYEESKVDREKVQKVLMDIVNADPADMYSVDEETGKIKMKTPVQLPRRSRNALKKITNRRGEVTYEFNGKTDAARLLGAWNGWDAPRQIDLQSCGNGIGELKIGFDDEEEEETDKM